jgi:uncharacterized membrane protein YraQ (UPF0718 family)
VAVLAAMAVHQIAIRLILKPSIVAELATPAMEKTRSGTMIVRLSRALRVSVSDFLDVMFYFVLGVAVASCFSTSVNQEVIMPLALNDWLATFSLMGFAMVLSLCSTSDAFIAATFVAFPAVAKLAFLIFGPMMDLKLVFLYSTIFRKRFVFGLAIGLFILIGLICVRLGVVLKSSAL